MHESKRVFRLLFVCTGNICRSPFAEILTRHLLVQRLGPGAAACFEVASAGTGAVVGAPVHPDTARELARWGLGGQAREFSARQLQPWMVERSDLVLGASRRHRAAAVDAAPAALRFAFLLREFVRLARFAGGAPPAADPVTRARDLVDRARSCRGMAPASSAAEDAVADPMGRPARAHQAAALVVGEAVEQLVQLLTCPP